MEENKITIGNGLLISFINSILKIINQEILSLTIDNQNLKSDFDFGFFDDDISFYTEILSHFIDEDLTKILKNITQTSDIFKRNLVQFMMYIQSLINTNKFELLYKDPIIKLDISLIMGYLVNNYGKDTLESFEFFFVCIKELEKKYGIKCSNCKTDYDSELKKKAESNVKQLLYIKKNNFSNFLNNLEQILFGLNRYEEVDVIHEIYIKYKNDSTDNSLIELENKYLKDKDNKEYMDLYLKKKMGINGYDKKKYKDEGKYELYEKKENQLKNNLFFSKILTIDLNNIDNCTYVLYFMSEIYKVNDSFFDMEEEFDKLLSRKEMNVNNDDYTQK